MRKPKNLHDYCDKATAQAFLENQLAQVQCAPAEMLFRIKVEFYQWNPAWEKEIQKARAKPKKPKFLAQAARQKRKKG
jgi:hypothetical protein